MAKARIPPKAKLKEGSHEEDIKITGDILAEARKVGSVMIPNTVDGNITVLFDRGKRNYTIFQEWEGKVASHTDCLRNVAQRYLIELRERRRAEDKKAKKKVSA